MPRGFQRVIDYRFRYCDYRFRYCDYGFRLIRLQIPAVSTTDSGRYPQAFRVLGEGLGDGYRLQIPAKGWFA